MDDTCRYHREDRAVLWTLLSNTLRRTEVLTPKRAIPTKAWMILADIIGKTEVQLTLDSLIFPKVMKKPSRLPWPLLDPSLLLLMLPNPLSNSTAKVSMTNPTVAQ